MNKLKWKFRVSAFVEFQEEKEHLNSIIFPSHVPKLDVCTLLKLAHFATCNINKENCPSNFNDGALSPFEVVRQIDGKVADNV